MNARMRAEFDLNESEIDLNECEKSEPDFQPLTDQSECSNFKMDGWLYGFVLHQRPCRCQW